MSIANAIRDGVLYDNSTLNNDELLNKVLSAFMQKGEWFPEWMHANTFALLVAEALDGGADGAAEDFTPCAICESPELCKQEGCGSAEWKRTHGVSRLNAQGSCHQPPMKDTPA